MEEWLKKYSDEIELSELTVNLEDFKNYLKNIRIDLEKQYDYRKINYLGVKNKASKGMILELLTSHILTKQGYSTVWSVRDNSTEIDLIAEKKDKLLLIECKTNPENLDVDKECMKLKKKLKSLKYKNSKAEFWFYNKPSTFVREVLAKYGFSFKLVLKELDETTIQPIKKNRFKEIFED